MNSFLTLYLSTLLASVEMTEVESQLKVEFLCLCLILRYRRLTYHSLLWICKTVRHPCLLLCSYGGLLALLQRSSLTGNLKEV